MDTNKSSAIQELTERVDALETAVAELRAEHFGRMADEDAKPKRIDFSAAGGTCLYHPLDHVKE